MLAETTRTLDLHGAEDHCGDSAAAMVRRALVRLAVGEQLVVLTNVAEHAFLVRALTVQAGCEVVTEAALGGEHRLVVR